MIVTKRFGSPPSANQRTETLGVELLSGRTGARVWSGGSLPESPFMTGQSDVDWATPCAVLPNGTPDLFVSHSIGPSSRNLARVSGRDGRVIWDLTLSENVFFLDSVAGSSVTWTATA